MVLKEDAAEEILELMNTSMTMKKTFLKQMKKQSHHA